MKRERLCGGRLDHVEVDHTQLDVIVSNPKPTLPIGRPWLIIRTCTYSKMIIGFHLGASRVQPSNSPLVVTRKKDNV